MLCFASIIKVCELLFAWLLCFFCDSSSFRDRAPISGFLVFLWHIYAASVRPTQEWCVHRSAVVASVGHSHYDTESCALGFCVSQRAYHYDNHYYYYDHDWPLCSGWQDHFFCVIIGFIPMLCFCFPSAMFGFSSNRLLPSNLHNSLKSATCIGA